MTDQLNFDLSGARVVAPDTVCDGGVAVRDGWIEAVAPIRGGEDCNGDFLIPGVVDLHTDHVERHVIPRSTVVWNFHQALAAHDAVIISGGTTTVFDSLSVGTTVKNPQRREILAPLVSALAQDVAEDQFRAEHFLHMRCEVCDPDTVDLTDTIISEPISRLVSLMDHTPGDRQSIDVDAWTRRNARDMQISLDEMRDKLSELFERSARVVPKVRAYVAAAAARVGLPLMSHDDRTVEHVRQAHDEGVVVSEFPTTIEAAREARRLGMQIVAGAPNYLRGGSQSGNVAASELLRQRLVDGLASDYIPRSPLEFAFELAADPALDYALPQTIAMVSAKPAAMVGLKDRGAIVAGLRADLVRVKVSGSRRQVIAVWRRGKRVF